MTISSAEEPNSNAADREAIAALGDFRKLAAMAPSNRSFQSSVARALKKLGDYTSARSILTQMQKEFPKDDVSNTIELAALERQAGNPEKALELLNGLIERNGSQTGMRYLYHRGWILNALGRYDEAIATLSNGIKEQPDYAYAYVRRACAYASVDRLADAANDLDFAAINIAALPQAEGDPSLSAHLARVKELATGLRSTDPQVRSSWTSRACQGLWNDEQPRTKSSLLRSE